MFLAHLDNLNYQFYNNQVLVSSVVITYHRH